MPIIAGADGCPAGWIVIEEDTTSHEIESRVAARIEDVFANGRDVAVLAIDIPIGLTESGARQCDLLARRQLGPRASSVFPAPIRPALAAASYEDASRVSRERQGKGITKQSFAIYPKIRSVDDALQTDATLRERVFEVHPEVCFQAWNGGTPMLHPKRTFAGARDRNDLVRGVFCDVFDRIRAQHRRPAVSDDDILDAFAALWTARRIVSGASRTLPEIVPLDSCGLPMRMVF
jgi:predicted RNase H-like nuclease